MSYERQLELKREQVVDVLTRVAKVDGAPSLVAPIVPSPRTERYRNKMEFAFGPPPKLDAAAVVGPGRCCPPLINMHF